MSDKKYSKEFKTYYIILPLLIPIFATVLFTTLMLKNFDFLDTLLVTAQNVPLFNLIYLFSNVGFHYSNKNTKTTNGEKSSEEIAESIYLGVLSTIFFALIVAFSKGYDIQNLSIPLFLGLLEFLFLNLLITYRTLNLLNNNPNVSFAKHVDQEARFNVNTKISRRLK